METWASPHPKTESSREECGPQGRTLTRPDRRTDRVDSGPQSIGSGRSPGERRRPGGAADPRGKPEPAEGPRSRRRGGPSSRRLSRSSLPRGASSGPSQSADAPFPGPGGRRTRSTDSPEDWASHDPQSRMKAYESPNSCNGVVGVLPRRMSSGSSGLPFSQTSSIDRSGAHRLWEMSAGIAQQSPGFMCM